MEGNHKRINVRGFTTNAETELYGVPPEDIRRTAGVETGDGTFPTLPELRDGGATRGSIFAILRPKRPLIDLMISPPIKARQRRATADIGAGHNVSQEESNQLKTINPFNIMNPFKHRATQKRQP